MVRPPFQDPVEGKSSPSFRNSVRDGAAGGKVAPAAIAELQRDAHAPWSAEDKQRFKHAPQGGLDLLNSATPEGPRNDASSAIVHCAEAYAAPAANMPAKSKRIVRSFSFHTRAWGFTTLHRP